MRIAYFDCIAGASGDMILGALLDAGLPEETLHEGLLALQLDDFDLRTRQVVKNGFSATKVDVIVADDVPARHLLEIESIVMDSHLSPSIKERAIAIFRRLGEVEAGEVTRGICVARYPRRPIHPRRALRGRSPSPP